MRASQREEGQMRAREREEGRMRAREGRGADAREGGKRGGCAREGRATVRHPRCMYVVCCAVCVRVMNIFFSSTLKKRNKRMRRLLPFLCLGVKCDTACPSSWLTVPWSGQLRPPIEIRWEIASGEISGWSFDCPYANDVTYGNYDYYNDDTDDILAEFGLTLAPDGLLLGGTRADRGSVWTAGQQTSGRTLAAVIDIDALDAYVPRGTCGVLREDAISGTVDSLMLEVDAPGAIVLVSNELVDAAPRVQRPFDGSRFGAVVSWPHATLFLQARNGTGVAHVAFFDGCGVFGIVRTDASATWLVLNATDAPPQCGNANACLGVSGESTTDRWFFPGIILYVEFSLILVTMAIALGIVRRQYAKSGAAAGADVLRARSSIGCATGTAVFFVGSTFLSLITSASLQGSEYLGNLLTTTLVFVLALPQFFGGVAFYVERQSSDLARGFEILSALAWLSVPAWAVATLDHPRVLDGRVGTFFEPRPMLGMWVLVTLPLALRAVDYALRRGDVARRQFAYGCVASLAVVSLLVSALSTFRRVEIVYRQSDVLVSVLSAALYPLDTGPKSQGIRLALGMSFVGSWMVALVSVPIFPLSAVALVHWAMVGATTAVIVLRRARFDGIYVLVSVSLAARVSGGIAGEFLFGFGILPLFVVALASAGALYASLLSR